MNNIQILKNQSPINIEELRFQYVFVDTNFLIDAFQYENQFNEILIAIRDAECTLLSIDELRSGFEHFQPPQFYQILNNNPSLLAFISSRDMTDLKA